MNPRIAFAFARGARVQYFWQLKWIAACFVDKDIGYTWRIHPTDEWMQYGLVSTRIRAAALNLPFDDTLLTQYGLELYDKMPDWFNDTDHKRLFQLFMAEELADEGL